eukprot:m.289121 g.289121  ORF g.289121 m.289121 type:complete len:579 (-) comp27102_c1_seq6:205-1941(-)
MVIKNIFSNSKLLWSLVVVGVLIVSLIETLLWRLGSAARDHGDAGPRFEAPFQKSHSMTRVQLPGSSKPESKASAHQSLLRDHPMFRLPPDATLAQAAVEERTAKDPARWPGCGSAANGSGSRCSLWFQMPPFATASPDLHGWWSPLTRAELNAETPATLFEPAGYAKTTCQHVSPPMPMSNTSAEHYPCCAGTIHNGGGHVPPTMRCAASTAGRLRFRRASAPLAPYLTGLRLFQELGDGKTLVFVGDSVVHQQAAAIECAARRAGCAVSGRTTIQRSPGNGNTSPCVGVAWQMGIRYVEGVNLTCPSHDGTTQSTSHRLIYMRQYRPCFTTKVLNCTDPKVGEGVWDPMEQGFIRSYRPDILVLVPMGSHFMLDHLTAQKGDVADGTSVVTARGELRTLFRSRLIKTILSTPGKTLMLLEPAAKHFNNDGGTHLPPAGTYTAADRNVSEEIFASHGGRTGAWPQINRKTPHGWRAQTLRDAVGEFMPHTKVRPNDSMVVREDGGGSPPGVVGTVALVRMFDLAESRPDIHGTPAHMDRQDYTHICYTPLFYEPLVDAIARAIAGASERYIPDAASI